MIRTKIQARGHDSRLESKWREYENMAESQGVGIKKNGKEEVAEVKIRLEHTRTGSATVCGFAAALFGTSGVPGR